MIQKYANPIPAKGKEKRRPNKSRTIWNAGERNLEGLLRMPELPKEARIEPELGFDACQWLEDYIAYSKKWSPRAYGGYHEACGLWLLSTIAARRVGIHYGSPRFTNLYIALIARTSIYAKSTTADIAIQVLKEVGFNRLLIPENVTPERFISILAETTIGVEEDEADEDNLFFRSSTGQRGWFYEEFGQHVAAMMKPSGTMSSFLAMLKRLDDCKDKFTYSTVSRKDETIKKPYLALLANLTPDCLKPFSKRGSSLWGDGFLARFALVCPPEEEKRCKEPFPRGRRTIPPSILEPLKEWNKRIGKETQFLKMTTLVRPALEAYNHALLDLMEMSPDHDLDGSYAKLHEKTLRIAVLLASVSGSDSVRLKHWARAQQITENWRVGLHELYHQINTSSPTELKSFHEQLLKVVHKLDGCTVNDASKYIYGRTKDQIAEGFDDLVAENVLTYKKTRKKTRRYMFPKESKGDERGER